MRIDGFYLEFFLKNIFFNVKKFFFSSFNKEIYLEMLKKCLKLILVSENS